MAAGAPGIFLLLYCLAAGVALYFTLVMNNAFDQRDIDDAYGKREDHKPAGINSRPSRRRRRRRYRRNRHGSP